MDERAYPLPDRFRVSLDPEDTGYNLLVEANKEQKRLAQTTRSPFSRNHREAFRQKAQITVAHVSLPVQQQAEAWALLGRYDVAFALTQDPIYQKYWDAVWKGNNCPHPDKHKYIREYVWSVKEGVELPLLACSKCDVWDVAEVSDEVAQRADSPHRGQTMGKDIKESLEYHRRHVQ